MRDLIEKFSVMCDWNPLCSHLTGIQGENQWGVTIPVIVF